jgi:prepilin-type N-terminal cleavage/methylation domain-containing protein
MVTINIQPSILNRKSKIVNPWPRPQSGSHQGGLKSNEGFTLIELLVVIVIMMFLAGITVPIVSSIQTNAKKGVTSAQISQLELALKQFESDFGVFPPDDYTASPITIGNVSIPVDPDLDTPSKCLVFFLGSKFTFSSTSFNDIYGPYIEFKRAQITGTGQDFTDNPVGLTITGVNGTREVFQYKDPFGIFYTYKSSPPKYNTASFDIYSNGPDKEDNSYPYPRVSTSDDITNW